MATPKVLQLSTPTVRNLRTLVWLRHQSKQIPWVRWNAVVTSLSDYTQWDDQGARVVGMVLTELDRDLDVFLEELYTLSKNMTLILLPQSILSLRSEDFWADNFDNILNLDQVLELYPYLITPWDGTLADAVAIFALLCRYNRLVDCPVSEARRTTMKITFEMGTVPSQTYLFTQYFVHSHKKRAKEIRKCLIQNCACPHLDQIVLLNETDLSHTWRDIPGKEKIKQVIIGSRLTYAAFLKYVTTQVPANVYAMLCNADIYMGDSLLDLWKINMTDRMLALLRWDDPDNGETPVIFGPRADSQDCWIVPSDSVQSRTWDWTVFDFPLGQAGCDNAFAGHMLRQRFVLSNPAMSFQTFHLHNSNIRNYNKKDYIRSDVYLNLVPTYLIDTKQEQVPAKGPNHICNELVSFEIQSSSLSNEITYCTMLEKEGRYKWEPSVENHYFEPAIPVYQWNQACVTPNGLVYDPYTIYTGKHAEDERFQYWRQANVDIFTPLQKRKQIFAIPFPNTDHFSNPHSYLLYYVSRCARLLKEYPRTSFCIPKRFESYVRALSWDQQEGFAEDTPCWAETVIGHLPSPSSSELGGEDVQTLRSLLPSWSIRPSPFVCVIVTDDILTQEWVDTRITPFLLQRNSNWTVRVATDSYDSVVGASLCIVMGGHRNKWSKLWALPHDCCVVEFQQELALNGEFQHLCHVASWKSWVLLLSKGSTTDVQAQVMEQWTAWYKKHQGEICWK